MIDVHVHAHGAIETAVAVAVAAVEGVAMIQDVVHNAAQKGLSY